MVLDGHEHLHPTIRGEDVAEEPAPEAGQVPEPGADAHDGAEASLDEALLELLRTVAQEEMMHRIESQADGHAADVRALTAADRQALALRLVHARNKVTHIYELVKAYGSSSQVTYNRSERAWERREAIAAKHQQEVAVNPFTGGKTAGIEHAPLVYARDPRTDLPADLQEHLTAEIAGSDEIIVRGWMESEHTA